MNLQEANRQLQLAVHDAQVAFDCVELGEIDRAHTHALMARTAADAAETALRYALAEERGEDPPPVGVPLSVEQESLAEDSPGYERHRRGNGVQGNGLQDNAGEIRT